MPLLRNNRFRSVFDELPDPLLIVHRDGRIERANRAATRVLALDDCDDIRAVRVTEETYQVDGEELLELLQQHKPVFGFRLRDDEGQETDVLVDVLDLGERKDKRKLLHIKDLSPHQNFQRWKDELIATMAHEIRNPLAAMMNTTRVLMSEEPGAINLDQNRLLTTSMRSMERLSRLLDGFLDVSAIGNGSYTIKHEEVDGEAFFRDVVESFQSLFGLDSNRLSYRIDDAVDTLYIDPNRVEQVLVNLLSNAGKYTPPEGRIDVEIAAANLEALCDDFRILPWADLAELRFVSIVVRDTGIGMDGATLSHLFTRFHTKADSGDSVGDPLPGSHLGMNITRTLTEAQNGTLHIDSEPGVGTEVTVYLPGNQLTHDIVARLKSVERCLWRSLHANRASSLYVLRKYESSQWVQIVADWYDGVVIDPDTEAERQASSFLWPVGADTAFALLSDEDERHAVAGLEGQQLSGTFRSGCMAGRCRLPEDGTRLAQLANLGLRRMKLAPPVVSGA